MSEWRWSLVWEDGSSSGGTHMHSGTANAEVDAFRDLAKTIMWIEAKWPSEEYFEGGYPNKKFGLLPFGNRRNELY